MDRFPMIFSMYSKYCAEGDYIEALKFLENEWNELPEPKNEQMESFHIVEFITEIHLILKDFCNAKEWSMKIFECDRKRADIGEREFLVGKVNYELGDFEQAKKYFEVASQKSNGRIFSERDGQYLKFFKKGIIE